MNRVKNMRIIFNTIFILMLILPLVFVNLSSNKISKLENRYLTAFPTIIDGATGKLKENIMGEIENWFNDNIGFRDLFVKLNTHINYNILNTAPNNKVRVGKEDWIFYTGDNNLEIANGTYPLTEELLLKIKEEQELIQKALADKGIEYILVLTPSKVSIYPEQISGANYSVRETPIDIVTKYLKENTTINVVNTKEELVKAKEEAMVFYKTDTHWSEEGAYIGYKTLVEKLKELNIITSDPVEVERIPAIYKGEFSAMMGDINLLAPENVNNIEIVEPNAIQIKKPEVVQILDSVQAGHYYYSEGNSFFENPVGEKKALIYGDSFFGQRKILNLLAENFAELNFIWSDKVMNQSIDMIKPDVVIFEKTERYIDVLAKEADSTLVYGLLKTHEAEIISHNTPNTMKTNDIYDFEITVRNTSNDTWSERRGVRLCIWKDGQDLGYRGIIPKGVEVKPGEEINFEIKDFQILEEGSTVLEYQMLEEGITYFGEKQRVEIQVQE